MKKKPENQSREKRDDIILLSHGGGGMRTRLLIENVMLRRLHNPILEQMDDGACLSIPETELVFTTDSYVVTPHFFPGGNIGTLAACGTINDLAMQGAEPRFLSLGIIIEEGFSIKDLEVIVESLSRAAAGAGAAIVAGDTKVIERCKKNDAEHSGIFINTSGIGARIPNVDVRVSNAQAGDAIIVTGDIGDHGTAIMCSRENNLHLKSELASDVAPLWGMIKPLISAVPDIHCMRDPTRGGLAAALCDIAERSNVAIRINESKIPVKKEVRGICDLLGLDHLNTANEGKALVVCPEPHISKALTALRSHPLGRKAAVIGRAEPAPAGMVILETSLGGERIVEMPMGDDLPRIC